MYTNSTSLLLGFQNNLKAQGYKPNTEHMLVSMVREFLQKMESNLVFEMREVTPTHILEHYHYLSSRPNLRKKGGLSSSMLNHNVYALRTFFAWLDHLNALEINPMTALEFPRLFSPLRKAFSKQEIKRLYEVCENMRDKAMLTLFYACGLRRSEGCELECKDIVYIENKIIIREGKFSKRREIPLHPIAVEHLRIYQSGQRQELVKARNFNTPQLFLLNNNGDQMRGGTCVLRLKYLGKQAGLPIETITLHHLRHSIATHLKENGMPIEQIMEFLGHASLDVTQGYLEGYRTNWHWQNKHREKMKFKGDDENNIYDQSSNIMHQ